MVDSLNNFDARGRRDSVAAKFASLIIIVGSVDCIRTRPFAFRNLNCGDLEIVRCLLRSMSAKEETMGGVWFVRVTVGTSAWADKVRNGES